MKNFEKSAASHQYAEAHKMHYKDVDLQEALSLYEEVIAAHPGTAEAKYARMQIHNIVITVVPKQVRFDAELELARTHMEH